MAFKCNNCPKWIKEDETEFYYHFKITDKKTLVVCEDCKKSRGEEILAHIKAAQKAEKEKREKERKEFWSCRNCRTELTSNHFTLKDNAGIKFCSRDCGNDYLANLEKREQEKIQQEAEKLKRKREWVSNQLFDKLVADMEAGKDISNYNWESADWLNEEQKAVCRKYQTIHNEQEQLKKQKNNIGLGSDKLFNEEVNPPLPPSDPSPVNQPNRPNPNSPPNPNGNKNSKIEVNNFDDYFVKIAEGHKRDEIAYIDSDGMGILLSAEEKRIIRAAEKILRGEEVDTEAQNINSQYKQKLRDLQEKRSHNKLSQQGSNSLIKIVSIGGISLLGLLIIIVLVRKVGTRGKQKKSDRSTK